MNWRAMTSLRTWMAAAGMLGLSVGLSMEAPVVATSEPKDAKAVAGDGAKRVTVEEARARAKLMHTIYAATLDTMHHYFFKREQPVLPARAMEDIFADLEREDYIKAAWISVNTKPMSIQHAPKNDFEKAAARAIAAGKGDFELIEDGYYRRAAAIPLGAGCVSCHTGFFSKTPQTQRFAGLVISVPIKK